ncbi:MAG: hypothetical protein AAFV07_14015 [Bacteroidota bacterium]
MRRLLLSGMMLGICLGLSGQEARVKFKAKSPKAISLNWLDEAYYLKKDTRQSDSIETWVLFGGTGGELGFDPGTLSGHMRVGQRMIQFTRKDKRRWMITMPDDTLHAFWESPYQTGFQNSGVTLGRLINQSQPGNLQALGTPLQEGDTVRFFSPLYEMMGKNASLKKWTFTSSGGTKPDPALLLPLIFAVLMDPE